MSNTEWKSPVYNIIAVPFEKIVPNTYNPNAVAPPEMKLLYDSIREDGYTMPIVCYYVKFKDVYVIVDGFHRYRVMKEHKDIYERENGSIDVALLDVMMPGEHDGLAVCRKLREKSGSIGIIMLTARTQEMDKVSGLMMGADDYVTKPFSPSELVARVDAVYRRVALEQMRNENNFREEIRSGEFVLNADEGGQADRAHAGGVPADGILLLQPHDGARPRRYFEARVGRGLLRRGEDRRREYPPPAHEGGG